MKQVLYVEDSATSQAIMRKHLVDLCQLTICSTIKDARSLIGKNAYDLFIADFLFPEGDALNLIQDFHRDSRTVKIPIIVVSGSMNEVLLNRVLKAGANDGLPKPLKAELLRPMVQRMLSEPYVKKLENVITEVSCFQWSTMGRVYEHCPEANLTLSAPTKEEVSQLMVDALQKHCGEAVPIGCIMQEMIVTHSIRAKKLLLDPVPATTATA